MGLLDKLLAAFKPKKATPFVEHTAPPTVEEPLVQPSPAALAEMASKLEGFVYDPELAAELAPAFVSMSAVDGFDKVMELFAAKEKQIEALNVGGQEQKSTPAVQENTETERPKTPSATDILRQRATAQRK